MRREILVAVLAVAAVVTPGPSEAQFRTRAASISLTAQPRTNDTTDHADVTPGSTAKLVLVIKDSRGRVISRPVTWSSDNALIATVSNGVITGKTSGYAKIRATVDGKSATIQTCVAKASLYDLTEPIIARNGLTINPTSLTMKVGDAKQLQIRAQLTTTDPSGSLPPVSCIHWTLLTGPLMPTIDTANITMSRRGLVVIKKGVTMLYVAASLGTNVPKMGVRMVPNKNPRLEQRVALLDIAPSGDHSLFSR